MFLLFRLATCCFRIAIFAAVESSSSSDDFGFSLVGHGFVAVTTGSSLGLEPLGIFFHGRGGPGLGLLSRWTTRGLGHGLPRVHKWLPRAFAREPVAIAIGDS